jgi:hypothetical protein
MQSTNIVTPSKNPSLTQAYLRELLAQFDKKKSFHSWLREADVVRRCRNLIKSFSTSDSELNTQQKEALGFIVFCDVTWNHSKIKRKAGTAVGLFLMGVQKSLFTEHYSSIHRAVKKLLDGSELLAGDQAQANFEVLTQRGGKYAELIVEGLVRISNGGLLDGAQAQANRDALTQGDGRYAGSIAVGLQRLSSAGLLDGAQAQANRDALTQGDGRYAGSIAVGLQRLSNVGLLDGAQAQANRDALTQGGGRYAGSIAVGLQRLSNVGLLDGAQAQANRDALTQGGGKYVGAIVSGLACLSNAGLLDGIQTQANFNLLVQSRGLYAESIAMGLVCLAKANLLAIIDQAQENFNLLTQGGGEFAISIAEGLSTLTTYRYLLTDEHAQIYRDALIQGDGQYAKSIAVSLVRLSRGTHLLAGDHAQIYCNALIQSSGQYAESIAEGLQILFCAGLLSGDQAKVNRNALTQSDCRCAEGFNIFLQYLMPADFSRDSKIDYQCEFMCIAASFKAVTYDRGGSPEFLTSLIKKIQEREQLTPSTYQLLVSGSRAFDDARLPRSLGARNDDINEEKKACGQILDVLGFAFEKNNCFFQKNKHPQSMLNQIISLHALVSTSVDELSPLVCELVSMVSAGHEYLLELCHSHLCHSVPEKRADVLVVLIQLVNSYLGAKDVKNDSLANEVIYTLSQQSLFERGFFKNTTSLVDYCQVVDYCKKTAAPGS